MRFKRFWFIIAGVVVAACLAGLALTVYFKDQKDIDQSQRTINALSVSVDSLRQQISALGVTPAVPPAKDVTADTASAPVPPGAPGSSPACLSLPGQCAGTQGPPGPVGSQGPAGAQGSPGKDGVNGTNGIDGKDGTNGTNGLNGADGAQGPEGPMGPQGPQGESGSPAPANYTITHGDGTQESCTLDPTTNHYGCTPIAPIAP